MAPQLLDELGPPGDDPRLRPAEQLVAGEADEIGAGGERLLRRGLARELREHAGAEVVDERQPVTPRYRCELVEPRRLGEADEAEVRLVHAQQQRRLRPDRALVVGRAGAVRRPDLDEARAGPREHVRDAEAVADLDQLAPRDDHLAALGERGESEQHRAGVVVDDERGLRAGEAAQDRRDVVLARAARAAGDVVLEVRVAAPDLDDTGERLLGERRAPEVRVDDHAGRVEHAAEARRPCGTELLPQPCREVAWVAARADLLPRLREHGPRRVDRKRVVDVARQLVDRGKIAELHQPPFLAAKLESTCSTAAAGSSVNISSSRSSAETIPSGSSRPRTQSRSGDQ